MDAEHDRFVPTFLRPSNQRGRRGRDVAAALMTSGKPLVYPQIYYAYDIVRQIGLACAKEPTRSRLALRFDVEERRAATAR